MRIALRERLFRCSSLGCAAAAAPARRDRGSSAGARSTSTARVHFYAVGLTALAAAAAAVALTVVGARFRDTRTVLVGTAFAVMAALLALHGLATPGFLVRVRTASCMVTGGATLPVGAAILALSVRAAPARACAA